MRVVVQRSKEAQVVIKQKVVGQISHGFVLLVGFTEGDGEKEINYCANKIAKLRVFSDSDGKMNQSLAQVGGSILSISQFTLYADTRKGNRPGFSKAQTPQLAEENYQQFNQQLRNFGLNVETGEFGADMQVSLQNDGPVTIIYDTAEL
ncbi:D-aminoacyl-tRNA deacylase [Ligilactobacillus pobuzihii]|uniref:D-aminoacyl-tRNA deacylase n=1 Tax=Ligilactobacillus pobuzihii TaxID=449659 RepID=A0A0R2LWF4_9LACO|nr:D-aminoacyl-tRNA deacylase [Ligilactobacillus pobuzihii]KRK11383.1 D-tyrosyl-tRNA(Tyr) deacylase [Ligilactobacillus pobuzihii E100301 = KCTC 13174]KRO02698.1 D-tyrosyl-tRNA(Tyr) deacylase [Ligilactobacillus pobuzihii]GEN47350.1 D-aminoacyl-tRNA deacylase [Ligilactobacillus pobuzihii]